MIAAMLHLPFRACVVPQLVAPMIRNYAGRRQRPRRTALASESATRGASSGAARWRFAELHEFVIRDCPAEVAAVIKTREHLG